MESNKKNELNMNEAKTSRHEKQQEKNDEGEKKQSDSKLSTTFFDILLSIYKEVFSKTNKNKFQNDDDSNTICNSQPYEKLFIEIQQSESLKVMSPEIVRNNKLFNDAILKDLKFVFMNYQPVIISPSPKNRLRYLLCFLLRNELNEKSSFLPTNTIKELAIYILTSFTEDSHYNDEFFVRLIVFVFHFSTPNYLDKLKEEFEESIENGIKLINSLYIRVLQKSLNELFNQYNSMKSENALNELPNINYYLKQVNKYLGSMLLTDYSEIEKIDKYLREHSILQDDTKYKEFIQFNTSQSCEKYIVSIICGEIEQVYSISQMMNTYLEKISYYYEINAILKDTTFQQLIYDVFSSSIIRNYYQIKPIPKPKENETEEEKNQRLEEEEKQNRVMNSKIVEAYDSLVQLLGDPIQRKLFFQETFCVLNLPHTFKGLTTRYLLIGLNYCGVIVDENKLWLQNSDNKQDSELVQSIPRDKRTMSIESNELLLIKVNTFIY